MRSGTAPVPSICRFGCAEVMRVDFGGRSRSISATQCKILEMTATDAMRSSATVEEEHERMLHPERYERAAEVLAKAPSGDTEFTTAQQAGSSGGSPPEAEPASHSAEAQHGTEELWDESFKPPSAMARADSPTSTLADRFVSAGGLLSRQSCMGLQT